MAWALQQAARKKQRHWDGVKQTETSKEDEPDEGENGGADEEAQLNARLASRGVDLSAPPLAKAKAYTGIKRDIANLGDKATFGDVMNLLRQGPQGREHTTLLRQTKANLGLCDVDSAGSEAGANKPRSGFDSQTIQQKKREHAMAARSMLEGIKAMQTMIASGEDPTRTALAMRSQLSTLISNGRSSHANGDDVKVGVGSERRGLPKLSAHSASFVIGSRRSTRRGNLAVSEENMPPIEGNGHVNAAADFQLQKRRTSGENLQRDGGSFGVPEGADIRTKGSIEHWTARKRTPSEWTDEEKKADEEKKEREAANVNGTLDDRKAVDESLEKKKKAQANEVVDLSTSVNVCVVQSTRHRSHVFAGLGCGDVRVIDLGPNTTLPSELPEESKELSKPLLLAGHKGYVGALVAVGQLVFSASYDGTIRGWKYSNQKLVIQSSAHRAPVHGLCYSASTRKVYSCSSDGTVRVWDLAGGKSSCLCEHFSCACFSITLSEKRNSLFVGLEDGSIAVVDARSGAIIRDLKGHSGMVSALHFSIKANVVASASVDGTCRVWFAGQCIVEYTEHDCPLYAICLLQGGTYAVSGGSDGTIHRWNCSTGACTTVYRSGVSDTIFSLLSHRGRLLSSGRDGVIRFWKASSPCEFCEERCDCAMAGRGAFSASSSSGIDGSKGDKVNIACLYQTVSCPNSGCTLKCARIDLKNHIGDCVFREMRCPNPGCKEMMPFSKLKEHNDKDCPYARVKCPNSASNGGWGCTAALRRRNLAEHVLQCKAPASPPSSPRSAAGGALAAIKQQQQHNRKSEVESGSKKNGNSKKKKNGITTKKGYGSTGRGQRTKIALRNSKAYREQLRRKKRDEAEARKQQKNT